MQHVPSREAPARYFTVDGDTTRGWHRRGAAKLEALCERLGGFWRVKEVHCPVERQKWGMPL